MWFRNALSYRSQGIWYKYNNGGSDLCTARHVSLRRGRNSGQTFNVRKWTETTGAGSNTQKSTTAAAHASTLANQKTPDNTWIWTQIVIFVCLSVFLIFVGIAIANWVAKRRKRQKDIPMYWQQRECAENLLYDQEAKQMIAPIYNLPYSEIQHEEQKKFLNRNRNFYFYHALSFLTNHSF